MKVLRFVPFAGIVLLSFALSALAQGNGRLGYNEAYCSGFASSTKVPKQLHVAGGVDGDGILSFSTNDLVYLSQGADGGVRVGQRYLVVRPVLDPDDNETFPGQEKLLFPRWSSDFGQLYNDVGLVTVEAVHATSSTARIQSLCDVLNPGDLVIPYEERPRPDYKKPGKINLYKSPSGLATGTVVVGRDFSQMMARGDPIYIDLGSNQGILTGDYLLLYRAADKTRFKGYSTMGRGFMRSARGVPPDNKYPQTRRDLPRELLGEAFVVRVEQKSSTAIITNSLREIHAGDFAEVQPYPEPKMTLTVTPESVERGESAQLRWSVTFADAMELTPGPGAVERTGTLEINPDETTSYTLATRGRGGARQNTVTLEVIQPPPPPPPPPPPSEAAPEPAAPSLTELFGRSVQDVFFDFNLADISAEAAASLQQTAQFLLANPEARLVIEGHADEVGSDTYNQRLGQQRAEAVRDLLVSQGVDAARLRLTSVGETQPFCRLSKEETCQQRNRRAHFLLDQ